MKFIRSKTEEVLIYLETKDVKAITEILSIAEKLKLEVLSMQFHKYRDMYSLLVALEQDPKVTKYIEIVNKVKNVEKVKLLAELPTTQPRPILIMIIKRMIEAFNGAARVFMFHTGFIAGRVLREMFLTLPNEEIIERILLFIKGNGLGRGDLVKYSTLNRCVIKMKECTGLKSKEPASYFFRGIISGLLSGLWRAEVGGSEVRCIALGDGYCEFLAVPFRTANSVYGIVRPLLLLAFMARSIILSIPCSSIVWSKVSIGCGLVPM